MGPEDAKDAPAETSKFQEALDEYETHASMASSWYDTVALGDDHDLSVEHRLALATLNAQLAQAAATAMQALAIHEI